MTFLELQKLALSRVGDVDIWDGGDPNITPDGGYDLVKLEVNTAYTHAVNMLTRKGHFKVVNEEIIKFPAGTREIDLSTTGSLPDAPTEALRPETIRSVFEVEADLHTDAGGKPWIRYEQ